MINDEELVFDEHEIRFQLHFSSNELGIACILPLLINGKQSLAKLLITI